MSIIISAFPGTGKTFLTDKLRGQGWTVTDSDSSKFSWIDNVTLDGSKIRNPEFPNNYIDHIDHEATVKGTDIILVSSHKEVREALQDAGMLFILVYPALDLKYEYIARFKNRGNKEEFINMLEENWVTFNVDLNSQKGCIKLVLRAGEYLADYIY